MTRYLDELGEIITEKQLYLEYLDLSQEEKKNKNFNDYIKECCSKNGTLTKIS